MKKVVINRMKMELDARSVNESFARTIVAAFAAQLDPTLEEIDDLKTAVSEAVTNCIVHAYSRTKKEELRTKNDRILIECALYKDRSIIITITDFGIGISNIEKALEPFFTTKPDQERSGMGFTVMQSFMTDLRVVNGSDCGCIVEMSKVFG